MQDRYQVKFELHLNSATSANNYEYLDILDRAWSGCGSPRPDGGVVCDVGSASFWYAAALQAFFHPRELVGVEVEGHRLLRLAERLCIAAGLRPDSRLDEPGVLSAHRAAPAIVSCWTRL